MSESKQPKPSLLVECACTLGEGPLWIPETQHVLWVDILTSRLFWRDMRTGEVSQKAMPTGITSIVEHAEGGFVATGLKSVLRLDADFNLISQLPDPEPNQEENRFNDGKVDRAGRYWVGTMHAPITRVSGNLYRYDGTSLVRTLTDIGITNGPAFSLSGQRMYHTDSLTRKVYTLTLSPEGDLSDRQEFLSFGEADGNPDGMTVDSEDCLWIAFYDGGCVRRFSKMGEELYRIDLPVRRPTSLTFGGAGLTEMFITSAALDQPKPEDPDGGLVHIKTAFSGLVEPKFDPKIMI